MLDDRVARVNCRLVERRVETNAVEVSLEPLVGGRGPTAEGASLRAGGSVHRHRLGATEYSDGMASTVEVAARKLLRRMGVEPVRIRRRPEANLLGWHLHCLFDLLDVNVVLDVGARVGEYGRWLRQNGYRGRIVSFEPVAASLDRLRRTAAGDPLWDVNGYALGAENAETEINVASMPQFSSLLPTTDFGATGFGPAVALDHVERVSVRRLDDVWDELPDGRVYLKMDTQGFDLRVLEGAGERVASVVALQTEAAVQLIYEGAPTHVETLAALNALRFIPSGMFPVTLDERMRLVEYDLVAVRS